MKRAPFNSGAIMWVQVGQGAYCLLGSWPGGQAEVTIPDGVVTLELKYAGESTKQTFAGDGLQAIGTAIKAANEFAQDHWMPAL